MIYGKKFFPNAKIIHVYRNAIDVAASLYNREKKLDKSYYETKEIKIKKMLLLGSIRGSQSLRVRNIEEGINLWREYIKKAFEVKTKYNDTYMEICYEDYLLKPSIILARICEFAKLKYDKHKINNITNSVDSTRRVAFIKDEMLRQLYVTYKNDYYMNVLGYNNLIV